MLVGFDFDNTLISYDRLFHSVALGKGMIPEEVTPLKNAVRDYLRKQGREEDWTRLQGEVYGSRILEAEAFPGVKAALRWLAGKELPMCIVSHKTRTPYLGEPWDLHAAARGWLERQGLYGSSDSGLPENQVFFELTKVAKVERICALGCTHYVDDLPEILAMLPSNIEKILFAPNDDSGDDGWQLMRSWQELPTILKLQ